MTARAATAVLVLVLGCAPSDAAADGGAAPSPGEASGAAAADGRARTWEWDGSAGDRAQGCAAHAGRVYVCGNTSSPDLAPRGVPGHTTDYGPRESSQAWFARVDPARGRLVAFTFFGVPGEDRAYGVHAGPHGVTGTVWSQKRTTWVVRYDADLRALRWKVALRSAQKRQTRNALDVGPDGTVWVAGEADGRAFAACVDPAGVRWERDLGPGYAQTGVRVVGEDVVVAGRVDGERWVGRLRGRDGRPVWERRAGALEAAYNDGLAVSGAGDDVRIAVCGTRDDVGVVAILDGGGRVLREVALDLDAAGRPRPADGARPRAYYEIGGLAYLGDGRLVVTGTVESTVAPWFLVGPDGSVLDSGRLPGTARAREAVAANGVVWISGNTSKGTPGRPWEPRSATLTRLDLD